MEMAIKDIQKQQTNFYFLLQHADRGYDPQEGGDHHDTARYQYNIIKLVSFYR